MRIQRPRGTGRIFQRGAIWWIKYHRDGQSFRESSGSKNRNHAERLLKSRLGEIADERFKGLSDRRLTMANLFDLVIDDYKIGNKRSLRDVEWRSQKHLLPRFEKMKASKFGSIHIRRYVSERRRDGASDSTINRELAIIRRGFTLARESDPPLLTYAPHIPKLDEDNARQGFLEHEQYVALLNVLPHHLKCLLVVGYHVGNRIGELRKLEWSQVDLRAKEIRMQKRQVKGKKPRTLPIYGEMTSWLETQKCERDSKWPDCDLVFHYLGRPIGSHIKGWQKACDDAGLPWLRFHDLRRSAVRNLERAGVPRRVAMAITGHRTESVYLRYDIVNSQDIRNAAQKMEQFLDRQKSLGTKSRSLGTEPGKEK
jgi:integrase